jgi:Ca2+-binding EF-hand superfamily protein
LSPELDAFKESFANFDSDGSGSIDENELGTVIQQLGEPCPDKKTLKALIAEVDASNNGQVEFGEFLTIVGKV